MIKPGNGGIKQARTAIKGEPRQLTYRAANLLHEGIASPYTPGRRDYSTGAAFCSKSQPVIIEFQKIANYCEMPGNTQGK